MDADQHAADPEPVGDPVCWLHELCPACGAAPSPEVPGRCWQCGTAFGNYPSPMARVNDVGGMSGFGPVRLEPDEPPFHADWEARVYALNVAMLRRGVYNLDQFRDAIERMPPAEYLAASYYERWLFAVESLTSSATARPGAASTAAGSDPADG
jgi:nitrile hydratase subunit beta